MIARAAQKHRKPDTGIQRIQPESPKTVDPPFAECVQQVQPALPARRIVQHRPVRRPEFSGKPESALEPPSVHPLEIHQHTKALRRRRIGEQARITPHIDQTPQPGRPRIEEVPDNLRFEREEMNHCACPV
ncbi:MAG TPA: hypothetical protein PLH97_03840 [Verrucomicrobiota bacterium]|nr:hypothetical protein [Verrucomicrobiota bacterium]